MRGEAQRYHRQARGIPRDLDDVGVRTGRQRRRRRVAAASAVAALAGLAAVAMPRAGELVVQYGGPDPTGPPVAAASADAPVPPSPPVTAAAGTAPPVSTTASTVTAPVAVSPEEPPPISAPATAPTTTAAPPVRAAEGRTFALAGGGCLFDGRPGTLTVELRGAGGGPLRLALDATGQRYETVAQRDGRWSVAPVVPAVVAPGAYPAVPVCREAAGSGTTDLTEAVTVVLVGGTPATVSTTPPPRAGR